MGVVGALACAAIASDATEVASIAPRAIAWAQQQSARVALAGRAPNARQRALARATGVQHPERIRIQVVDRFPLPREAEVKAAALKIGLASPTVVGLTLGYSVMVRRGHEGDPRLLSHEFRHVSQYEAHGGIEGFLTRHLQDLARFGYEDSPFEVDARAHEVDRHL
jgi:hypothetical protein